jgi:large subunit ribosomal protein L11
MAKKVAHFLTLQVPAGAAKRSSVLGAALDPYGIDPTAFCKVFNAETQDLVKGAPVKVTFYPDYSFKLGTKKPHGPYFIGSAKSEGAKSPAQQKIGIGMVIEGYGIKPKDTLTTKSGRTIMVSPAKSSGTSIAAWSDAFKK